MQAGASRGKGYQATSLTGGSYSGMRQDPGLRSRRCCGVKRRVAADTVLCGSGCAQASGRIRYCFSNSKSADSRSWPAHSSRLDTAVSRPITPWPLSSGGKRRYTAAASFTARPKRAAASRLRAKQGSFSTRLRLNELLRRT